MITPLDPSPGRTNPGFKAWAEALLESKLSTAIDEVNVALLAFNTNDLRGTSSTAYTPNATGEQDFTVETGKSWVPGMWVTGGYTLNGKEYWAGPIVSYSGSILRVDVKVKSNTSTSRSNWQIAFSPPVFDLIGDHQVVVRNGNGYGSTNVKRRRYSTLVESVGTSITYADSAANGATFTINDDGLYVIQRTEEFNTTPGKGGVALNPSSGTNNYTLLSFDEKLGTLSNDANTPMCTLSITRKLAAGDVVVMHDDGSLFNGVTDDTWAMIMRIK